MNAQRYWCSFIGIVNDDTMTIDRNIGSSCVQQCRSGCNANTIERIATVVNDTNVTSNRPNLIIIINFYKRIIRFFTKNVFIITFLAAMIQRLSVSIASLSRKLCSTIRLTAMAACDGLQKTTKIVVYIY